MKLVYFVFFVVLELKKKKSKPTIFLAFNNRKQFSKIETEHNQWRSVVSLYVLDQLAAET